nr:MAG TPA: hypothetical protein [Caudoviricetes sp.]
MNSKSCSCKYLNKKMDAYLKHSAPAACQHCYLRDSLFSKSIPSFLA